MGRVGERGTASECGGMRAELSLFTLLLVALNLPLFVGQFSTRFLFHPGAVAGGEWWRLLTHPWVHVSCYHLALDAAAFLLAYMELGRWRWFERIGCLAAAGLGSLLTTLVLSPQVNTHGLCGLSGIAHGLAALASLQAARSGDGALLRAAGWIGFVGVAAKCVIEAFTGQVLFVSWHLGWLGTPMAGAHLGGLLGALAVCRVIGHRTTPRVGRDSVEP